MFPHENYPYRLSEIDEQLQQLQQERQQLLRTGEAKPLPPHEQRLIELAYEAGEMKAKFTAAYKWAQELEKKLKTVAEQADRIPGLEANRDSWKRRAMAAEEKIERSERAKKALRKSKVTKKGVKK